MVGTPSPQTISTKQLELATRAERYPHEALSTLAHFIDLDWLREAYRRTRKDGAPGVDGQVAAEYEAGLEANLSSLLDRFKSGRYRAPPVKRVYIPKGDGKRLRPIGIPTLEDKVLQRAVVMILEPLYEQQFLDASYGFRPGRSAHQALDALWQRIMPLSQCWLIELDIESFFDRVDRARLREMVARRVGDGVILRAIGKWLQAGVLEGTQLSYPEQGTPQGGVITPRTQKRTSSSSASYAAGGTGRCLICASRSNMFMSHGAIHPSRQGAAFERRVSTSRAQDRAVGSRSRPVAELRPVAPSSISVSRGGQPSGAAGRGDRVHRAHHVEAHAEHRAGIARVCDEQRAYHWIDRHARSRRLPHICQAAWLSGAQAYAPSKFISTMPLTDCATRSSHRSTTSWFRRASASLVDG